MSGIKYLVDTNILLYTLSGDSCVASFVNSDYFVSEITEIELLGNKGITSNQIQNRSGLLENCTIIELSQEIKRITVHLKQIYTLKIPDAITAATSIYLSLPLLTADKDFKKIKELDLILVTP